MPAAPSRPWPPWRNSWSATPTGQNGGIWQSGQGPAADDDGSVYLITGNGTFDANRGGQNYGDSFVKLRLENGTLARSACAFKSGKHAAGARTGKSS